VTVPAIWSAVAKRSGDTAFPRSADPRRGLADRRRHLSNEVGLRAEATSGAKSGVAGLRPLPPHSKSP